MNDAPIDLENKRRPARRAVLAYMNDDPDLPSVDAAYLEDHSRWDGETTLVDLLADLKHWADEMGFDFDDALRLAEIHHFAEVAEHAGLFTTEQGTA